MFKKEKMTDSSKTKFKIVFFRYKFKANMSLMGIETKYIAL